MKCRIRPARGLQAKIILSRKYFVEPIALEDVRKKSWIDVEVPDESPGAKRPDRITPKEIIAQEDYDRLKYNLEFYWKSGDIEIEGRIKEWEQKGYKKTIYKCQKEIGHGEICGISVYQDDLCYRHWEETQPEERKPFPKHGV